MTLGRGMLQCDAVTIWGAGSGMPKRGSGSISDRLRQSVNRPTTFPPCRNGPATIWRQARGNPSHSPNLHHDRHRQADP